MKIDLTRRRFLFGLAAAPLVAPVVTHFIMPASLDLIDLETRWIEDLRHFHAHRASTDFGSISEATARYAAQRMLEAARPVLVLKKFGERMPG